MADSNTITAAQFRQQTTTTAMALLKGWVGEERALEATGRIATAIAASAACSKKPEEFYSCTPQSVGSVIAISALTGIMPSTGATALAYAIPRRARKGEQPQLTYQLSHRGINALAGRAGLTMIPIPISVMDTIQVDDCGEIVVKDRDIDNPPMTEDELRGVVVLVKHVATGQVLTKGWVSKKLINQRRASSDAYTFAEKNEWAKASCPWHVWYVEQAMKTALHYAIARGWCVIDDTEAVRALSADVEADSSANVIEGKIARGNDGLRAKLGVRPEPETYAPEATSEPETVRTSAPATNGQPSSERQPGEFSPAFVSFRDRMNRTTKASSLVSLKGEVELSADLTDDEHDSLMEEIEERISMAKADEAEAPA